MLPCSSTLNPVYVSGSINVSSPEVRFCLEFSKRCFGNRTSVGQRERASLLPVQMPTCSLYASTPAKHQCGQHQVSKCCPLPSCIRFFPRLLTCLCLSSMSASLNSRLVKRAPLLPTASNLRRYTSTQYVSNARKTVVSCNCSAAAVAAADDSKPAAPSNTLKLAGLGVMFFCSTFCYTCLQNLKDSLVVTSMGAECLPFLEAYGVLPGSVLFYLFYRKLVRTWLSSQHGTAYRSMAGSGGGIFYSGPGRS